MKLKPLFTALFLSTTLLGGPAMAEVTLTPMKGVESLNMTQQWDKIFPQSNQVEHHKVRFKNRFGITLVGDLYIPKNAKGKLPAIAVSGPFGAVKEQTSGLYAQTLAERGFVTLAFDPSYTGESDGTPRNMASPDVNTEDFSAALDYLGLQNFVDRNRLGVLGICGLGGMALNDAAMDTRVKAVATSVMYDMSRSIGWGVGDQKNGYTPEQRQIVKTYLNNLRWADAESGERAIGLHEVVLDPNNNVVPIQQGLPDELPANANPVLAQFHNFYKTQRGYHPRSINSTTAWTATMPLSFVNIPMMSYISEISPRPMLIVTGENAHSRYMAEEAYQAAGDNPNKELVIVPNATHVDLYDNQAGKIPFDTFADFFKKHL
ncbi:alpha/beta hydrolase [Avibacterium paragallinarum]|uniref:alpha/beta hydrolase n=1 Tax=Avibacterium paragallinarum TaxID=728 RepID=UPI001A9180FF|nr:alpha/beta hydrolase [Avibacterium paragallinarum]